MAPFWGHTDVVTSKNVHLQTSEWVEFSTGTGWDLHLTLSSPEVMFLESASLLYNSEFIWQQHHQQHNKKTVGQQRQKEKERSRKMLTLKLFCFFSKTNIFMAPLCNKPAKWPDKCQSRIKTRGRLWHLEREQLVSGLGLINGVVAVRWGSILLHFHRGSIIVWN